mgnify:CR=1 FL=1
MTCAAGCLGENICRMEEGFFQSSTEGGHNSGKVCMK